MKYFVLLTILFVPAFAFAADEAFVSLTNIPALTEAANSSNLPVFLNNLYKICIGLAAVLAVLQIIRAGIMYMMGDSLTEKKEAKNLIALSIMGLVLVLSPTIVFGLINKDILELNLDIKSLALPPGGSTAKVQIPFTSAEQCKADGGTVSTGDPLNPTCTVPAGSPAASKGKSCDVIDASSKTVITANQTCGTAVSTNHQKVEDACCAPMATGGQCCAKLKTSTAVDVSQKLTIYGYVSNDGYDNNDMVGLVPMFKDGYDKFVSTCTAAGGKDSERKQGYAKKCSAAALAAAPSQKVLCQEYIVSCELPK